MIQKEVLKSYLEDTRLIRNSLYKRCEVYDFTQKMVDDVISDYNRLIDQYLNYLKKMYINGNLLLLDITDDVKKECVSYSANIGLGYDNGILIYEKFIKDNNIKNKNLLLDGILYGYKETGKLAVMDKTKDINTEFDNNEYKRIKDTISQIESLQSSLYKKSGTFELSDDDRHTLYEMGMSCGIRSKSHVDCIIQGNEINLGVYWKIVKKQGETLFAKNANKFSFVVSPKDISLLGKSIEFESCYFMKKFTEEFFSEKVDELKKMAYDIYRNVDISQHNSCPALLSVIRVVCMGGIGDIIEEYLSLCRLYNKSHEAIEENELFGEIYTPITDMHRAFEANLLVHMGGDFEEFIQSFNLVSDKLKQNFKNEIFDDMAKFIKFFKEKVPMICMSAIIKKYPYSIWIDEAQTKAEEKLKEYGYHPKKINCKTVSDDDLLKAIKNDRFNYGYYKEVLSRSLKQSDFEVKKTDIYSLLTLTELFDLSVEFHSELLRKFAALLNQSKLSDSEKCFQFHVMEDIAGYSIRDAQDSIYGEYVKKIVGNVDAADPNQLGKAFSDLAAVNEYGYSTYQAEKQLIDKVFKVKKINLKTVDESLLKSNIDVLSKYNGKCNGRLSSLLDEQKQKLDKALKEKEERRREDIRNRTINVIADYDISKKEFKRAECIASSLQVKDRIIRNTKTIEEECKKLSVSIPQDQFVSIVKNIRELSIDTGYGSAIESSLNKQRRTVDGVEYSTIEEADSARREMDFIQRVYSDNSETKTQRYYTIATRSFQTDVAQKLVQAKEQELIQHINNLNVITQEADANLPVGNIVIIIILWTLFFIFGSVFLLVVTVLGTIIAWSNYRKKTSDSMETVLNKSEAVNNLKKEINEFNSLMTIQNDHIVLLEK